jgi:hypothetical protein
VLFKLGDITMTGCQLIKCLEEDNSTKTIMNTFVQCLEYGDVEKQCSGQKNHFSTTKPGEISETNIFLAL